MFKDKIKLLRKARGLSQQQLADIIGVDVSTVGKWEGKGNIIPSDGVRERIADFFNVPLDYLMDRANSDQSLDDKCIELISVFNLLNMSGKQLVIDYARMISDKKEFREEMSSAMAM